MCAMCALMFAYAALLSLRSAVVCVAVPDLSFTQRPMNFPVPSRSRSGSGNAIVFRARETISVPMTNPPRAVHRERPIRR